MAVKAAHPGVTGLRSRGLRPRGGLNLAYGTGGTGSTGGTFGSYGTFGTYGGLDRFGYDHDRNSNRTRREHLGTSGQDELYVYDGLDRLAYFPEALHVEVPKARRFMYRATIYSRVDHDLAPAYPPAFRSTSTRSTRKRTGRNPSLQAASTLARFRTQGKSAQWEQPSADAGEIEMILNNLVSNAVKYNRDGGRVDVDVSGDDEGVTLTVADTGIGMTAEEAERLFQDFVRIKNSKTRDILGSGLGLSIVKKLANLYDGSVAVDSGPDTGSTFTVTLSRPPGAGDDDGST